ncbi:MAG: hypothetical protein ROZ65_11430 [Pseudomonadaceae bacterium]|jgi:hypothetical protein|nr:hypothetical protein [Pseudomonadaceae bacterium]
MQTLTPQSRAAILENPDALECTLYRPDEYDEEAEEQDLGDARIIISGPFEAPAEWDTKDRDDYFDGTAPEAFVVARIACEAAPGSGAYFTVVPGDYAAVTEQPGKVSMFYVWDCLSDAEGQYVLIREEEEQP